MKREKYIWNVLTEHLLNKDNTYSLISEERAEEILGNLKEELRKMVTFGNERDLDDELKVKLSPDF